jgi:putative transposase
MQTIAEVSPQLGIAPACAALGFPRASYYRALVPKSRKPVAEPKTGGTPGSTQFEIIVPGASQSVVRSPRALQPQERRAVLDVLHEPRFADQAPAEVYATLLDEHRYLCSERTMYRILAENQEVRERRAQLHHPRYAAPELLATRPNQLWSWDITKLLGPAKWSYFHLYVILDVFSRYVVGWMVADRESASLAERLIAETCARQQIARDQLTLHADRGSSMKSKPVALLLADLGVTKTHSRPHVSNDNPFSESQFKTLKYRPDFPERFGSAQDARQHCADFFPWYNCEHHHVGLGLLTPHDVHHGLAASRHAERALVLAAAHSRHPERFPRGTPKPPPLPVEVWINKPVAPKEATAQ